jgi:diaminopimelate decarboxylase
MSVSLTAVPFDAIAIVKQFGSPTWVYLADVMRQRISELKWFDVIRFAQKANSNLGVLALMKKEGVVVDAVTAGEVARALRVGFSGEGPHPGIVFTADLLDDDALAIVEKHRIPVNCGSPNMLQVLAERKIDVPITLRLNPGFGHGHSRKVNTGGPWSKHGIWHEDLDKVLAMAKCGLFWNLVDRIFSSL